MSQPLLFGGETKSGEVSRALWGLVELAAAAQPYGSCAAYGVLRIVQLPNGPQPDVRNKLSKQDVLHFTT